MPSATRSLGEMLRLERVALAAPASAVTDVVTEALPTSAVSVFPCALVDVKELRNWPFASVCPEVGKKASLAPLLDSVTLAPGVRLPKASAASSTRFVVA